MIDQVRHELAFPFLPHWILCCGRPPSTHFHHAHSHPTIARGAAKPARGKCDNGSDGQRARQQRRVRRFAAIDAQQRWRHAAGSSGGGGGGGGSGSGGASADTVAVHTYGHACDWWSLGIVLYEMLVGDTPFYCRDTKQMFKNIIHSPIDQVRHLPLHPLLRCVALPCVRARASPSAQCSMPKHSHHTPYAFHPMIL